MGFLVVLGSMFFLMKSITLDPVVNGFFGVSAGLGFLILIAGWIPSREPTAARITPGTTTTYRRSSHSGRPTGQPVFQPVYERNR